MMKFFFLLQILVSTALGCDLYWEEFDGDCYLESYTSSLTYEEAEEMCQSNGGHLPIVSTQYQAQLLQDRWVVVFTGMKWQEDIQRFAHPVFGNATLDACHPPPDADKICSFAAKLSDMPEFCLLPTECNFDLFACQILSPKTTLPTTTTTTTTTTTRPPTTTSATTTTTTKPKPPTITDPKKWIIDYSKGTQIHRSFHSGQSVHHYTIDWRNTPAGFNREAGNGFVVSEARFPQIKETCPNLFKVGIWRYGAMTYIGNSPPGSFVRQESFYCAPSQFYCGANFLLRRLDKQQGGDILYASNETEANQQLLGFPPGFFAANWYKETPCWIWQDYTDTWYSIVKANGGMIWSGYNSPGIVHFYTLQRHLIPADFQKERAAPPGYVVLQNLYNSYFKTRCPELIPMKIWHGQNGVGQTITWIGREGRNPPSTLRNGWVEELRFYCAPRFNYCNANFLLRRMDKTNGAVTFYYPWSEANAAEQLRGDAPGVFKNPRWSEEVCYIWANWY